MSASVDGAIGIQLGQRLGLQLPKRQGHDMAGPCVACQSSDAFRLHTETGVAHCFSCGAGWSPFSLAERVLGDREQACALMIEIGIFPPGRNREHAPADPMELIARKKGVSATALIAYGASRIDSTRIALPAYGPNGVACSSFSMSTHGGKGMNAAGKDAGLFFPHQQGKVRLPIPGETWHVLEGPKDPAALYDLGLLAAGLNTARMNAKFARLFLGVNTILIPDRDRAGENGAAFSAGVLRGVASSILIATLPAEFLETKGADVRDILRRPGGREQVLQAIADARPPEWWYVPDTLEIPLPGREPLKLEASESDRKSHRLIVATCGELEYRDLVNLDSGVSRDRFFQKLARKLGTDAEQLAAALDPILANLARQAPAPADPLDSAEWERLLQLAQGLRGKPPSASAQRELALTLAACLAHPGRREWIQSLLIDLLGPVFIELLKK
jgi:hypothetical protein